jgi:2-hydroxycyclohexanecarboxyl-CoA dehydrogenase
MGESSVEKVAVVTGAASGIGLGIAQRLARDGAKVAITDVNGKGAEAEAAKVRAEGGTAVGLRVDVSDRADVDRGVAEVHDRFGPVTILVNNAASRASSRSSTSRSRPGTAWSP